MTWLIRETGLLRPRMKQSMIYLQHKMIRPSDRISGENKKRNELWETLTLKTENNRSK